MSPCWILSYNSGGIYAAGLFNSSQTAGFYGIFPDGRLRRSRPMHRSRRPTPIRMTTSYMLPYTIQLIGVSGGLVVKDDFGSNPMTASLVTVPEPSSLLLTGIGVLLGLGSLRCTRRRS